MLNRLDSAMLNRLIRYCDTGSACCAMLNWLIDIATAGSTYCIVKGRSAAECNEIGNEAVVEMTKQAMKG